jgi:glycosyltransferase involved in cell wall biosynthesis
MNILHVTPTFYPATYWGGPIWSTKAICDGIARMPDMSVRVLTSDAAGPDVNDRVTPVPLPYPVHYARRMTGHSIAPGLLGRLPRAMHWADVVHLTGVYNTPTLPVFALAKALGKPMVWSPRGALQATQNWSQAPRVLAKKSFERALNVLRPRDSIMHVTATAEATQSIVRFADMATVTIANAVDVPVRLPARATNPARTTLIFLGRLHPKKGLDALIDAMRTLPEHFDLDVYGSGDGAYCAALRAKAADLGARVRFHGHLADADKAQAFARSDLFVLPSYSENFGIAVAEALAHSVPVLTTTATPWQALDAQGCGRCICMDRDDLGAQINSLCQRDLGAMGARGRAWVARDFSADAMHHAFGDLYRSLAPPTNSEVYA